VSNKGLTYSKAGVSIIRGDRLVDHILPLAKSTHREEVVTSVGGFAALSKIPEKYKKPLLVVSTDGVGTKVLLARECHQYDTIGIDLVAMSVNDVLTLGAEPLLFLDYFATGRLDLKVGKELIAGVAEGCKQAGCALVGGETAEMPQVYRKGDFDLAGFCVGVIEEGQLIDGRQVKPGDYVIGIPSNGIHSNGFSLVRAILKKEKLSLRVRPSILEGKTLGEELLVPTRIYVPEIRKLMKEMTPKAMAHITGGGIEGNLSRVLPDGVEVEISKSSWDIPKVFLYIQEKGRTPPSEMYRTFNMGIGFVIVVGPLSKDFALKSIAGSRVIGDVKKGKGNPRVVWKS